MEYEALNMLHLGASMESAEQAALNAVFKRDRARNGLRAINYLTIEPDFVGTEVEHTALLNGLEKFVPGVNEASPVQELREIRDRLLGS